MKKRKLMSIFLVLGILLLLILLASLFIWRRNAQIGNQEEVTSEEETTVSEEETTEEIEVEVVYPKPHYDFRTEEIVVEIPNLTKEYTIAWVSDLHIVTDDKISDDILEEDLEAVKTRHEFFQTEDGVPSEELLPEVIDFLNYGKFDGIIFGGDILDYCSKSNMEKLNAEFERLNQKVPTLYIRADHDYGFWYGGEAFTESMAENLHKEMADGDDLEAKYLDFDEFIIAGINRSTKDMRAEQYDILDEIFTEAEAQKKPVIVATHVPYGSRVDEENEISLYDKSMEVKNKVYYWGGGNYIPNEVTNSFLEQIYKPDTNVAQVLAGHLHAGWDGMLTEQVKQHIFSPSYLGNIGIIKIVPKENS